MVDGCTVSVILNNRMDTPEKRPPCLRFVLLYIRVLVFKVDMGEDGELLPNQYNFIMDLLENEEERK